ncbi:MAG: nucleotidyltransferase family protein [Thermodesulfobacteriota bacterium]
MKVNKKQKREIKTKSLEEINSILKEHKEEFYKKYNVKEIGIFGSFVRGEQKNRSDIDILVEFEVLPDLLKFIEMERYLEKLLRKKVDLVEKTALRPQLKEIILKEVVYI